MGIGNPTFRAARKSTGLTREGFALKAGVGIMAVKSMERGHAVSDEDKAKMNAALKGKLVEAAPVVDEEPKKKRGRPKKSD